LSVMKGKDQSLDSACVVSDLSALNNNPDAIFPEIAVRYEPGGLPQRTVSTLFDMMARLLMSSAIPWLPSYGLAVQL
jgi:hypothetical protein